MLGSVEYVARVRPGVRVGADDVRAVDRRTPDRGAVDLFAPWTR